MGMHGAKGQDEKPRGEKHLSLTGVVSGESSRAADLDYGETEDSDQEVMEE